MWLFIKSLFMVKDRQIAREMVAVHKRKTASAGFKLAQLMRRRNRRNRFAAHNTTLNSSKVK
jgi:hypothetical protein